MDVALGESDSETSPKRVYEERFSRHDAWIGEKLIQLMHTTMVSEQVKIMKIQAGVQVSRPGELRRHLQLWKCFGRLYFVVIVYVRNIIRKCDAITVDINAIALFRQAIGSSPGRNDGTASPGSSLECCMVVDAEVLHELVSMVEKNKLFEELMIVVMDTE
ncbi:hypothetical protein Tco_0577536 [Tanacetum coccineum]